MPVTVRVFKDRNPEIQNDPPTRPRSCEWGVVTVASTPETRVSKAQGRPPPPTVACLAPATAPR